jgi:hypothetical protein
MKSVGDLRRTVLLKEQIAKGTSGEQFDTLLRLLNKGFDPSRPFHTADLYRSDENVIAGAIGAAGPYDTGGFIVLGEPRSIDPRIRNRSIRETGGCRCFSKSRMV